LAAWRSALGPDIEYHIGVGQLSIWAAEARCVAEGGEAEARKHRFNS